MLDLNKISIGRVRQAFKLNLQDAGILIAALAERGSVDLYELWHEAVRFFAVEENNKKSMYDEVDEPYFPDVSDMGNGPLEGRILTKRLLRHFLHSARSEKSRELLQRIFNRVLNFTYDSPDEQQADLSNRILDLMYEQGGFDYHGKDKVDIGWKYVRPELFERFCNFFDDAIFADKEAAVVWLDEHGYAQARDVKGLSMELGKRILAAAAIAQPHALPVTLPSSPPIAAIIVPRSLWEGKTRRAVREAMRKEDFSDSIIAHILFTRCDVPKTEIAKLLDTNTKRIRAFLEETSGMNIVDS